MTKKAEQPTQADPMATENPQMATDTDARFQEIARVAYLRAEARGFEPGGEVQDWIEAEREVDTANAEPA